MNHEYARVLRFDVRHGYVPFDINEPIAIIDGHSNAYSLRALVESVHSLTIERDRLRADLARALAVLG